MDVHIARVRFNLWIYFIESDIQFDTSQWKPWRWFALEKEFSISILFLHSAFVLLLLAKIFLLLRAAHYISNWIFSSYNAGYHFIASILFWSFISTCSMFDGLQFFSIFRIQRCQPVQQLGLFFPIFQLYPPSQINWSVSFSSACLYFYTHGSKSTTNGCITLYNSTIWFTRARFQISDSFPFS